MSSPQGPAIPGFQGNPDTQRLLRPLDKASAKTGFPQRFPHQALGPRDWKGGCHRTKMSHTWTYKKVLSRLVAVGSVRSLSVWGRRESHLPPTRCVGSGDARGGKNEGSVRDPSFVLRG